MPTYEYACTKCGHGFEQFQSIVAEPLKKCPACSKPALKRLIGGGGGLIFKGTGFYSTDYRKGGASDSKGGSGESKGRAPDAGSGGAAAPKAAAHVHAGGCCGGACGASAASGVN